VTQLPAPIGGRPARPAAVRIAIEGLPSLTVSEAAVGSDTPAIAGFHCTVLLELGLEMLRGS